MEVGYQRKSERNGILTDVVDTGYEVKNSMLNEKLSKLSVDDRDMIYEVIDTIVKHSKQA